jgi:hypothetical protein
VRFTDATNIIIPTIDSARVGIKRVITETKTAQAEANKDGRKKKEKKKRKSNHFKDREKGKENEEARRTEKRGRSGEGFCMLFSLYKLLYFNK